MTINDEDESGLDLSVEALRQIKADWALSAMVDRAPISRWPRAVPIFDMDDVRRQLGEGGLDGLEEDQPNPLTSEEEVRVSALRRLARDPQDATRPSLVADATMIERVGGLRQACPHFASVIDLVWRAAHLSRTTGSMLRIPPTLLLGPPGIGKTYFAKRLSEALVTSATILAMNTMTDAALLFGHPSSWKGAKQGLLTRALVESTTAAPVFLLDEVDKLKTHWSEDPYNVLLTFLERENAAKATDEYLLVTFHLHHAIILLTANDLGAIPDWILDRLLVVDVPKPSGTQLEAVVRSIYRTVAAELRISITEPTDEIVALLARRNPRRIGRVLELAFGYAAADGRTTLSLRDISLAEELAAGNRNTRPIGFMRGASSLGP